MTLLLVIRFHLVYYRNVDEFQIVDTTNDQSAARLELKLVSFSSNGKVSDGTCCDTPTALFGCNGFGATDCDPQLKVCLG